MPTQFGISARTINAIEISTSHANIVKVPHNDRFIMYIKMI